MVDTTGSSATLLAHAQHLVPIALEKARGTTGFAARWSTIISKLERVPSCLSDLSTHPCFSKNALCREQLQSISKTLSDTIELAGCCSIPAQPIPVGKLQMQSDLDALSGKLDLNLRDCALLVKTGVLGDATLPSVIARSGELEPARWNAQELLARLQLGHAEAKHQALDGLLDAMRDDEKNVLAVLGRSNVSSIVQLLAATSPKIKEKAVTIVSLLVESGSCDHLLVIEGVVPALIRIAESGSLVGREKAVISLQRLSLCVDTARMIARHGGIHPLIEICAAGDSISQSAAACALKNLSAVPELRQALADEGVIRAMISMLDCGIVLGSKEYAAECLQNLTASNDNLRRSVVSEGGVRSLLSYLDGPSPPESAISALRNLIGSVSTDTLVSLGLLPRLIIVLKDGSISAQQTAASVVCKLANSVEMKRLLGELGCVPLLVKMLETKINTAREAAVQALATLITCQCNSRELKKDEKSVPNLVQLLDPSPLNSAKKYAVTCLLCLSSSKRCRKLMISYGVIGYLKKLSEMDVPGSKKLIGRLERGKLRSLFSRK
ncbi:Armadillo-like helical-containing protein [Dioscorea alata]|uniref:Armadillo-like helical-containing protein n=1 Tax=Dioscorea alata TaxID=55571 RepID=A0ACB7UV08_DIOAL|nr:Armadillo-like helical-containing protein [Dioscorea alata]